MPAHADAAPLALIGVPAGAARAFRELGIVAVGVPDTDLKAVLDACHTLRFCGALVGPSHEEAVLGAVTPDADARRVGRVDAVSFTGGFGTGGSHGAYALTGALMDALEATGYAARGASAVLLGNTADDLARALPLSRLGFTDVGVVADSSPDAERAARDLPAGVRSFAMSRRDSSLSTLTERADLIVLTGGSLPAGLVQPYHTVIDLTGRAQITSTGATSLNLSSLPARRLVRQLAHATGHRFHLEELEPLVRVLG
ncbi:hypothetical protein [Deinococcus puniceus]|uniref:Shikimate dehydrogenase n=1 Tax=Deinococcus puniceus TaxID=1182568 RepID=A0A172TAH5_9DEIO|nr:hypothetical protein [Deinococcus puniceus]ANE44019.1 shikimate dehydrogenase [Deinococcus puniceus]